MLVKLRMKNYKSFYNEMIFSMTPAAKQKGLDYSVLNEKVGQKIKRDYVQLSFMVLMHLGRLILLMLWKHFELLY